ncbi:DivIVA domain-containing protein [Streptomyces pathocidini]|uniref:DivIVA domain-containing protein n=1 Tax=Streptomyces pathocidini TaxID=1650571 RepID=A0ABW7UMW5_9ACTN|nr:DivIVA domain-containing protein [Streptomyces pathocidini]
MFWFLLIALVAVVAAVTLVVVGGDDGVALPEALPDRLEDPLPADRPVGRADVEALRLPMAVRGYRMAEVDEALDRLGTELAERDARIEELEAALAGAGASAPEAPRLPDEHDGPGGEPGDPGGYAEGPAEYRRSGGYEAGPGPFGPGAAPGPGLAQDTRTGDERWRP